MNSRFFSACFRSFRFWPPLLVLAWCGTGVAAFGQSGSEIDVMVVYTEAVRGFHGGEAGVQAHIYALVASANLGLEDSGIGGTFRLAHATEVDYVESAVSLNEDLSRMWNKTGGFDEVALLREELGIDLVCLLRKGSAGGAAGVAYVLKEADGRQDVAFSVVGTEFGAATFLHELGHNLGAGHARGDSFDGGSSSGGLDDWSNGYRFTGNSGQAYRTVMAYAPGHRIMQFSSPDLFYDGVAMGRGSEFADSADNARTLDATFPIVEGYREPQAVLPRIASQPEDASVRYGESAIFRVGVTRAWNADYRWYEGETGDTSSPVVRAADGIHSPVLTVHARIENTRFWVRVRTEHGFVDSAAASLHVLSGFPPRKDQSVEPTGLLLTGGVKWQAFVPQFDHLDHILLPLDVWGAPGHELVVAVTTSSGAELARRQLNASEVAGGEWNVIPFELFLEPGQTYKIMVDLGVRQVEDYFGVWAKPGPPYPDGSVNLADAEIGFGTYGHSTNWFAAIDPPTRSVSDFRDAYTIAVGSNTEWTVTPSDSWLHAIRSSSSGTNGSVRVELAPFDESSGFQSRSGYVIVGNQIHFVTQEAITPTVDFAMGSKTLPAEGGEYPLDVTSNFRWQARVNAPEWVTLEGANCCNSSGEATFSGEGDLTLNIRIAPNLGTVDRVAEITIMDSIHLITQEGVPGSGESPGNLKMGGAAFARFDGIMGSRLVDLHASANFPDSPDHLEEFGKFEWPGEGENYGLYAWAWLVPEVSGDYTFWIASDDEGVLSMSPDGDSTHAEIVARVSSHTAARQFDRFAEQKSATLSLVAGTAYYIEAQMKQGWSDGNLSVAWAGPGIAREVIPGRMLGLPGLDPDPVEFTGTANLAVFNDITGKTLDHLYNDPTFPDSPDRIEELPRFTYLGNGDRFGLFAWAWVVPVVSGDYTFWLSSDDEGELLLSGDSDAAGAAQIARVPGHSGFERFDKFPEQRSAVVTLEAGMPYYLAAAAKQEWGGSHLSVAWQGPGFSRTVIPGNVLTAVKPQGGAGILYGVDELNPGQLALGRYDGVFGKTLSVLEASPSFPDSPDETVVLDRFDFQGSGYNFGLYAWAWLIPETSGMYRFWLASDDEGELRLSSDADPHSASTIATVATHTNPYQYEKMSSQRSAEVHLEEGTAYYMEAVAQQGWGGVNLSVAWEGPGFTRQTIPGRVLALPDGATAPPRQ